MLVRRIFKMFFILSITLIILFSLNQIECATQYIIHYKNYYVSYPDKANWYESKRFCAYHRMHLIDIISPYENDRILSIINVTFEDNSESSPDGGFWTSGSDLGHAGRYSWATSGQEILYNYWGEKEPFLTSANERCIMYLKRKDSRWSVQSCETNAWFICRDQIDSVAVNEVIEFPDSENYDPSQLLTAGQLEKPQYGGESVLVGGVGRGGGEGGGWGGGGGGEGGGGDGSGGGGGGGIGGSQGGKPPKQKGNVGFGQDEDNEYYIDYFTNSTDRIPPEEYYGIG